MRFYISGSISNGGTLSSEECRARIETFFAAEEALEGLGCEVRNPARHEFEEGKAWLDYMRLALVDIAASDALVLLPGWEESRGARIEEGLARDLGLPVGSLSDWMAVLSRPNPQPLSEANEVGAGEPASDPVEESPDE